MIRRHHCHHDVLRSYARLLYGLLWRLLLSVTVLYMTSIHAQSSILGYWKTFDGSSPKPRSIIKIVRKKHQYIGQIVHVFSSSQHLKQCNHHLIGLPVLWAKIHHYNSSCRVFNPDNGNYYSCTLVLAKQGRVLRIHPYIEMPLFGINIDWIRTVKP